MRKLLSLLLTMSMLIGLMPGIVSLAGDTQAAGACRHTECTWIVTRAPVGFAAGEKVRSCTACGETVATEVIYNSFGLGDEANAEKILTGLSENISPDELMAHFANLGYEVSVTDKDGGVAEFVGTGTRVTVGSETYEVVIQGDVYGDGNIDIFDLMELLNHVNGDTTLEGVFKTAGLVYNEEEVDIFDLMSLLDHVNGDSVIEPSTPPSYETAVPETDPDIETPPEGPIVPPTAATELAVSIRAIPFVRIWGANTWLPTYPATFAEVSDSITPNSGYSMTGDFTMAGWNMGQNGGSNEVIVLASLDSIASVTELRLGVASGSAGYTMEVYAWVDGSWIAVQVASTSVEDGIYSFYLADAVTAKSFLFFVTNYHGGRYVGSTDNEQSSYMLYTDDCSALGTVVDEPEDETTETPETEPDGLLPVLSKLDLDHAWVEGRTGVCYFGNNGLNGRGTFELLWNQATNQDGYSYASGASYENPTIFNTFTVFRYQNNAYRNYQYAEIYYYNGALTGADPLTYWTKAELQCVVVSRPYPATELCQNVYPEIGSVTEAYTWVLSEPVIAQHVLVHFVYDEERAIGEGKVYQMLSYAGYDCDFVTEATPPEVSVDATPVEDVLFTNTHYIDYRKMGMSNTSPISINGYLDYGWAADQFLLDGSNPYTWYLSYGSAVIMNEVLVAARSTPYDIALRYVKLYASEDGEVWTNVTGTNTLGDDGFFHFALNGTVTAKYVMLHMSMPTNTVKANWNYRFGNVATALNADGAQNVISLVEAYDVPTLTVTPVEDVLFTNIHSTDYKDMGLSSVKPDSIGDRLDDGWDGDGSFLDGDDAYVWYLTYATPKAMNEVRVLAKNLPSAKDYRSIKVYASDDGAVWTDVTGANVQRDTYFYFSLKGIVTAKYIMLYMETPADVCGNWNYRDGNVATALDPDGAQTPVTLLTEYPSEPTPVVPSTMVYRIFDIQRIGAFGNNEDYNDLVRLYTSLQGRVNKVASETNVYIYQMYDSTDEFWLSYISEEGKMFAGSQVIDIRDWDTLWSYFGDTIAELGIAVWDPAAPATANVAATICAVDGYLPVRYDTGDDSLYTWLTSRGVAVKMSLRGMFTGELGTTIADTDIPSSGSIKCDPYLWAMEKYFDRCNPTMLAYVLDGASQVATNSVYHKGGAPTPNLNQLYSHDYYIYNECFFIDLTCVATETPCDDPNQPLGTDRRTLETIFNAYSNRNNGNMTKLMGFPPWFMKYTTHLDNGATEPVALEWAFTALLTSYNLVKEADAAHPAWMTNASVYCQYEPTVDTYVNNDPPATEVFDSKVRYFTFYIGDYDSSAWLKEMVPTCFMQSSRGKYPLMWAFNPNLADRVPMIFDYVYQYKTDKDYFITGDSGAGYVMPVHLKDLELWKAYNKPYLEKFDMDIVGFILDDVWTTEAEFKAYSEMGIKGACYNNYKWPLVVYGETTPFIQMTDFYPGTEGWLEGMYNYISGNGTNFAAFRNIRLYTDQIVESIEAFEKYANAKNDGYTYKYVDMYTLFDLILQSGQGEKLG